MRRRLGTFKVVFIGILVLYNGCTSRSSQKQGFTPPSVQVVRARKEPFQPVLNTFGTLTYSRKADVYSFQEGTIQTLLVEEGDRATEGQVLATLSRERLLIAREQAIATVTCRKSMLDLAEVKLMEGFRAVEARLLSVEKAEAELAQKGVEHARLAEVWETKKKLFHVGGIPGGDVEAFRTQYLKGKTDWEQAARDLEIQRIGFRDEDLIQAGYSLPASKAERITLLKELGTKTLKTERDVAQGELSIARAELHRIELLLSETEIRSPLDGIVSQRAIEIGEKVSPETLLFSIYDPESLYASVEVHERDLPCIQVGHPATIQLEPPHPIPVLSGKVRLIAPYLNSQSLSTKVRILLDPPYNKGNGLQVFPGTFVRVKIPTGPIERLIRIPETCLLTEDSTVKHSAGGVPTATKLDSTLYGTVFVVRDSILFKVPVLLSNRTEGKVEVRSGIEEGDLIVVNPTRTMEQGERVEVLE